MNESEEWTPTKPEEMRCRRCDDLLYGVVEVNTGVCDDCWTEEDDEEWDN